MLRLEKSKTLFNDDEVLSLLRINRFVSFLVALGFLFVNVCDKKIKRKYNKESISSDLQVIASIITLASSMIVLYVAFSGDSSIVGNENPEKKKKHYFASSVTLVSLMTTTFIVPGYCRFSSILFLISLATLTLSKSSIFSG